MRRYSVYVIELDEAVWRHPPFRKANPERDPARPCAYVGMTGRGAELRLEQHRAGYKANRYARDYGLHLVPAVCVTDLTWEQARMEEVRTGERLRAQGWGVWQA